MLLAACSDERSGAQRLASEGLTLRALLAHPFYLVKEGGTRSLPPREQKLLRGFGVTVREVLVEKGERIGVTASGLRLRLRDLEPPLLAPFEGVELLGRPLELAWVLRDGAPLLRAPEPGARAVRRLARLARVQLARRDGPAGFRAVAGGWMREADLAIPTLSSRPPEVGPGERWLDVSLRSQTLVAYQGSRPVFATLISSGVGGPGSAFATPVGTHRIIAKRLMTSMSNLEHTGVDAYYSYEEVPLAQFIGRQALHGVYWHDGFGQVKSHGCVNLSLRDALRLFDFTSPTLPAGASEVTAEGRGGTVVRVR